MVKKYLVPIRYTKLGKPALFATDIEDLKLNEYVLVATERGEEVGRVAGKPVNIESFPSKADFSLIIARANTTEIHLYEDNIKRAKKALKIAEEEAKALKLEMNFLFAEYVLDSSKIIITYTADNRVDFRELLRVLAGRLHTRIEFRQIGARDKAKATGGIGPCGRALCCATFLKSFDGISINRAKNQQLSLNAAKLSGACGKLMCCLLYEDETYSKEAKAFPPIGSTITKDKKTYKVLGFNIVSKNIKCEGPEGIVFINLKDLKQRR